MPVVFDLTPDDEAQPVDSQESGGGALSPGVRRSIFAKPRRGRKATINHFIAPIQISDEDARNFFHETLLAVASPFLMMHRNSMGTEEEFTLGHLRYMIEEFGCKSDFGAVECQRLYETIRSMSVTGTVGVEEFVRAVQANATLRSLLITRRSDLNSGFNIPENFDYSKSTVDNYKTTDATLFTGPLKEIRRRLDYSYHSNFCAERQAWQDSTIQQIILRTKTQAQPWLVFTCGPMGVGKGFALNWMSQQGYFPLEHIVHVDPDGFKTKMPEWCNYVESNPEDAGTLCHRESTFMMEIAQQAAMQSRQNVWIDGSLRDADHYHHEFREIRESYPHYRIAIFYVTAKEETIRARIHKRSVQTGRSVPEELIIASLKAMDRSLNTLTPLCDFVARINNDEDTPRLMAFEQVDTSGTWEAISSKFAKQQADESEFPNALAPFKLSFMEAEDFDMFDVSTLSKQRLKLQISSSKCPRGMISVFDGEDVEMVMSQLHPTTVLNLKSGRRKKNIPDEAANFAFVYPVPFKSATDFIAHACTLEDLRLPVMNLVRRGAFIFFDENNDVSGVHTICEGGTDVLDAFWGFGQRQSVPLAVAEAIPDDIFQPTPGRYREASRFAWIPPHTMSAHVDIGGNHGSFIFHVNDAYYRYEPVII